MGMKMRTRQQNLLVIWKKMMTKENYPVSDDLKTEDDLSAPESDDQDASESDDQDAADSAVGEDLGFHTQPLSSFGIHLEHKLTEAEIESLSIKKWRYKWDVSAAGMSKGKWAKNGRVFCKRC